MIDFFGQKEYYLNNKKNYEKIFKSVLSNESLLRGKSVYNFEKELAYIVDRKYAIAVNSGTDAILISLSALGLGKGDEVIVPAFSFIASATPIKMLGATPVFIDVNKNTGLIDIDQIQSKISKKTRCLISVDLFGECPDYDRIIKICKDNKIFLLEDGAQSFGSLYKTKKAGSFGDISTISFDVSKTVFGISTAGAILTNNKKLYNKMISLRGHGFNPKKREFEYLGYNSNMSSLNASLLSFRIKLDKELSIKRQYIREYYDSVFKDSKNIKLLYRNDYSKGNNHKYVILVKNRKKLMEYLEKMNIPTKIHYNNQI